MTGTESPLIPAWIDGVRQPVDKLEVHRRGLRHDAVSVFVNCGDATLLQRRAAEKYHTPGLWSNACCTHPAWDEPAADCATRRLAEELNLEGAAPRHRGRTTYRADVGGGLIEHEDVEIFTVELPRTVTPEPDAAEVAEIRWIDFADLVTELRAAPGRFTSWLAIYLERHLPLVTGAR